MFYVCVCVCVCVCVSMCISHFSHVQLFVTLRTIACQAPLSIEFARQEYWNGFPCPSPGDLPHPGIEPASLTSPASAGELFTTSTTWEAHMYTQGSKLGLPHCRQILYHLSYQGSMCVCVCVCVCVCILMLYIYMYTYAIYIYMYI